MSDEKSTFLRFWHKQSVVMRLVLTLLAAAIVFYAVDTYVNAPLREEMAKIDVPTVPENSDLLISSTRQNAQNLQRQAQALSEKLAQHPRCVNEEQARRFLTFVRALAVEKSLVLMTEAVYTPETATQYDAYGQVIATQTIATSAALPDNFAELLYRYKFCGTFAHLHAFLNELQQAEGLFTIQNIKLDSVGARIKRTDGRVQTGIDLQFDLIVPYLKNGGAK